jgi:hypothetical protein
MFLIIFLILLPQYKLQTMLTKNRQFDLLRARGLHASESTSMNKVADGHHRYGLENVDIASSSSRCGRVRFDVDANDCVVQEVFLFERHPAQCDSDMYWSTNERREFLVNARREAVELRSDRRKIAKTLENSVTKCADDQRTDKQRIKEEMRVIFMWVESNGRGLENAVTRIFSRERRFVVKQILELQAILQGSACESGSKMTETLRAYSVHSTSRAREFAFKLALGDALAL